VSKKEIRDLITERDAKKLTLFPVSLYNKGTKIKVEIALGRGKKVFDKRETIKKRDVEREMRRVMK
jgi:SsrA-binding protein